MESRNKKVSSQTRRPMVKNEFSISIINRSIDTN